MQSALISYRDSKAHPTDELPLRTWVRLADALAREQMRFEPGQLAAWRLKERDRDLDAEDRGRPDEMGEAREMRGVMREVMRGREDAA